MAIGNYANNVAATSFAVADLHHAKGISKLTPSQASSVLKVSKGTVGIGTALTVAGAAYEYKTGQANTHTLVDILVGGTVAVVGGAAIALSAPVWGTAAAVVGLGYGIWSIAGGSSWIDNTTNNWGQEFFYGK